MLAHAVALGHARSYLAALTDQALTFDASIEYERVLLQLDYLHGDLMPAISRVPAYTSDVLYDAAFSAIEELTEHGIDLLSVELLLDMLEVAWSKDLP